MTRTNNSPRGVTVIDEELFCKRGFGGKNGFSSVVFLVMLFRGGCETKISGMGFAVVDESGMFSDAITDVSEITVSSSKRILPSRSTRIPPLTATMYLSNCDNMYFLKSCPIIKYN